MKKLNYLLFLFSVSCVSQSNQLYDLAFSEKKNFDLLELLGGKTPKSFLIIDSTETWNPNNFFLEDIDLENPQTMKEIADDEHHQYHCCYLFSNKELADKIDKEEKIRLVTKSKIIQSKKIDIHGKNYSTIKAFNKHGYYFLVTETLYTENGR